MLKLNKCLKRIKEKQQVLRLKTSVPVLLTRLNYLLRQTPLQLLAKFRFLFYLLLFQLALHLLQTVVLLLLLFFARLPLLLMKTHTVLLSLIHI